MKAVRNITLLATVMGLLLASVIGSQFAAAQTQPAKTSAPTPTPTPPIEEQEGVIKVDTEAVNVLLTAQDKNRKLLLTLKPADLQIFENGQPQEISSFARHVDLPLSLAILIDTSMSQERTLPEEKMAAMSFLESVVRPEKDEVSIISFTGESTLEQGMTSNMSRLRRAIEGVRLSPQMGYIGGGVVVGTPPISGNSASGATAVWDAIWITSEEILGPAPEKTRRAIILLSDGVNTYGKKKLNEAVEAAQKAEAVIYAIGIGDNFTNGVDRGSLDKVAERTGGRAYFPRDEADLRKAFQQIQEEMRSQYMVSYEPTNPALDGSYRTIEIKLLNPDLQKQKIQLTHRKGYFAKTQKRK
ncbi:MAG TPA: VWA domain-containing protein [Pyrinomonadaceae bacterium]|nr:VWA domain-containing protein [Pyrinomonadaceae bacterium]